MGEGGERRDGAYRGVRGYHAWSTLDFHVPCSPSRTRLRSRATSSCALGLAAGSWLQQSWISRANSGSQPSTTSGVYGPQPLTWPATMQCMTMPRLKMSRAQTGFLGMCGLSTSGAQNPGVPVRRREELLYSSTYACVSPKSQILTS